jgi:carboxymethylenebutenolidase
MDTRTVDVDVNGATMPVYEALPDAGTARRGVVVIQEAFGVNHHIEDVTRRFAAAGYHAVAPHLFHRAGGGTVSYYDFASILPKFEGLTDDHVVDDFDAAKALLNQAGIPDPAVGTVGFCFGGRVTFLVALERAIGGSVGFYGGGIGSAGRLGHGALIDRAAELKTPWLGIFGDEDQGIPVAEVEAIRTTLDQVAKVDHDILRYPGAGHGFHCDARPSYHQPSAEDGWARALGWLDKHLAG